MKNILLGVIASLLLGAACAPIPYEGRGQDGATPADNNTGVIQENTDNTNDNNTDERTTLQDELRQAFAQKYNKPIGQIQVEIGLAKENKFVRGDVKIGNAESPLGFEGGIFYAVRDSVNGNWIIVHDGNGTIPCEPLELADFPESMMGGCVRE